MPGLYGLINNVTFCSVVCLCPKIRMPGLYGLINNVTFCSVVCLCPKNRMPGLYGLINKVTFCSDLPGRITEILLINTINRQNLNNSNLNKLVLTK